MTKHSIRITSIRCNATSESGITDGDEVYLVCQADGGLPIRVPGKLNSSTNMEKGDVWEPADLVLNFTYEVLVTLWDHDLNYDPNLASYLQSTDFEPGSGSGSRTLKNHNGADYTVSYQYID
ncbi:hypothetical protein [Chitinophaga sp.]|uniref:hypothetical protein n=1 Tax=Chitinophaga sp. TaxID=1869181 RepID=UPI002606707E|nr:hypothetical protein [uncultured Chitinophaga sp.]